MASESDTPKQHPAEAITKDSAPDKSNEEASPILRTEIQIPPGVVDAYKSEQHKSYRLERRKFWVEVLTLLAVVGYGIVAALQWKEMRRSTDQAKVAANVAASAAHIAEETLKSSRQSFQIEQRPYVIVDVPQFVNALATEQKGRVNITFKNIGRTPAIKKRVFLKLRPYRTSTSREQYVAFIEGMFGELRKLADTPIGKYGHLVRQDIAPGSSDFSTGETQSPMTSEDITNIQKGSLVLFYAGIVTYTDVFNGSYETEFCYFYFGPDAKTWHICDSHNIIK